MPVEDLLNENGKIRISRLTNGLVYRTSGLVEHNFNTTWIAA
jgi:hypothetical protein